MASTTRRSFLKAAPAAAAVAAVPVAIASTAKADTPAIDRFNFHLAELKRAAEELDPRIGSWTITRPENDDAGVGFLMAAYRVTGRYIGDGIYEGGSENWNGGYTRYQVSLRPEKVNGHRSFEVNTQMDRMILSEPRLNTFIRSKVG